MRVLDPPLPLPERLEDFLHALRGPAILRVPGADPARTRVVVTLLHGNEPSGVRAVHRWLRGGRTPATDALFVIPAVEAALTEPLFRHRSPPGRPDLNRCFEPLADGPEGRLAAEMLQAIGSPEALVDLHNTTGETPPYGLGMSSDPAVLALTSHFSSRFVESDLRIGSLVEATHPRCPSVVIECGLGGSPEADGVAREGLERFLEAEDVLTGGEVEEVYETPMRVCVRPGVRLAIGTGTGDFLVRPRLDRMNLVPLPAGFPLGDLSPGAPWPLAVLDSAGADRSRELFRVEQGTLETRREVTPVMMTADVGSAVGDCLFYAVRRKGGGRHSREEDPRARERW